jgi:hypothetical protein
MYRHTITKWNAIDNKKKSVFSTENQMIINNLHAGQLVGIHCL